MLTHRREKLKSQRRRERRNRSSRVSENVQSTTIQPTSVIQDWRSVSVSMANYTTYFPYTTNITYAGYTVPAYPFNEVGYSSITTGTVHQSSNPIDEYPLENLYQSRSEQRANRGISEEQRSEDSVDSTIRVIDTKAENNESACVCCSENAKIMVFQCGHLQTCGACTEKLDKCPICRSVITTKIRVFT
jgi:hypothetical protein